MHYSFKSKKHKASCRVPREITCLPTKKEGACHKRYCSKHMFISCTCLASRSRARLNNTVCHVIITRTQRHVYFVTPSELVWGCNEKLFTFRFYSDRWWLWLLANSRIGDNAVWKRSWHRRLLSLLEKFEVMWLVLRVKQWLLGRRRYHSSFELL